MDKDKYIKLAIIAGIIITLDQITKALISSLIELHHTIPVIPGFFYITHILNPGGAFGFLAGQSAGIRVLIFLFVSFLAVCLIFYLYKNTPKTHPLLAAGFAMIFGGAIGNMIDRLRFGMVVDFLDFDLKFMRWPAFNVADSAITIGMIIFVYHIIFKKMPDDRTN